ncbi:hypothetical protein IWW42_001802 [Coemansia sp. RSA 1085]|nr:hypothetical protein IWW42_001802 [Coemansia sp. RSA 1085]
MAQTAYHQLIEQTVCNVVSSQLMLLDSMDVARMEQATAKLTLEITQNQKTNQRDIEYAFHIYIFDLAQQLSTADPTVLDRLTAAIDIATLLSDNGTTDSSFVFLLLEEMMDMVSIEMAQKIFGHVERRSSILRQGMTATGGKGIVMLRMCNNLLRRIPQATMSEFAGRVQLFNSFALSERSGVNLRGDFDHTSQPHIETTDETTAVYRAFWSLQKYFADPQLLLNEEHGGFKTFAQAALQTIDEFRRTNGNRSATLAFDPTGKETLRHLTSPALLQMQFGDAQFKCQVLLQLLIFTKYVMSMSGDRIKKLKETATNKFVLHELQLSEEESKQLQDIRKRAGNQLVSAANDRGVFSRTAQFVLFHETCWAKWKAESCKPFEQPPLTALVEEVQAAAQEFLKVQSVEFGGELVPMGSEHLAEVWQTAVAPSDLSMLGEQVSSMDLMAAMNRLDIYCRDDSDYELLTASEQTRADLLQWRALRSSVFDNMFRKVDPSSHSLATLREEVFPQPSDIEMANQDAGSAMEVA